jgi:hypothetical protein
LIPKEGLLCVPSLLAGLVEYSVNDFIRSAIDS